ncbi:hypothetical protein [Alkalicoccobacillus murimartini]|uniref:Magnesium-transporting ATPase (P-type) n=1 Tax=Alkalicoccobacillus murimartini TaxID=171685 RepID=A0ABT9YK66_9BACI|nr:hypothetical protein [Alkalicoccobacillus murimartini]MDQ0207419.1 magnesium-transporting ATPase (P-type) [Alkalicoccobacillus murimartini]
MTQTKKDIVLSIELVVFLVIGFILTYHFMGPFYAAFDIPFMGNIWVNWLGLSYTLFVLYSLLSGLLIGKLRTFFKERLTSKVFWLVSIGSIVILIVPFINGENPF